VLARHLEPIIERVLRAVPAEHRLDGQIALTNAILDLLGREVAAYGLGPGDHAPRSSSPR
jgi:spore maturation protein SpmA